MNGPTLHFLERKWACVVVEPDLMICHAVPSFSALLTYGTCQGICTQSLCTLHLIVRPTRVTAALLEASEQIQCTQRISSPLLYFD